MNRAFVSHIQWPMYIEWYFVWMKKQKNHRRKLTKLCMMLLKMVSDWILHADDILLLSPSVEDLQTLNVCETREFFYTPQGVNIPNCRTTPPASSRDNPPKYLTEGCWVLVMFMFWCLFILKVGLFIQQQQVFFLLVMCTALHVTGHFHSPLAFFMHISCFSVFITGENN